MRDLVSHVLEKVEVAPALLMEIVRRTEGATLRAGIAGAAFTLHLQVELMRLRRSIEVLIHQVPRWLNANPQQQNLVAALAVAPLRNPFPSMAQPLTGFHSG
jgi:hypothetical protein